MKDIAVLVGAVVGVIGLIIGLSALFALPVMWLWKYVVLSLKLPNPMLQW